MARYDTALGGRYRISLRYGDNVIEEYVTPDEAVFQAGRVSAKDPYKGVTLIVWTRIGDKRIIKAIAAQGSAMWVRPCPQSNQHGECQDYCTACAGLGAVPQ